MTLTIKSSYDFKLLVIIITGGFSFYAAQGQAKAASVSSNAADTTAEPKKTTLTIAALYSNNASYYGQAADEKMPYIALTATVRAPFGGYVSGLAYKLFTDSSFISATSLTAGYQFNITKKLSGDLNFTHSFYPERSPFLQASNPNIAGATFNYEHFFTSGISLDYAFGKESSDYFVTLSNFKAFDIYTKDQQAIFSITPQIDIIAGTQQFYSQYREKRNNKGGGKPQAPPGPPKVITTTYKQFGMLSYNFKLPLSYSRASYMLEAAYQLSVLGNNVASETGATHSFITLSAYYQF